MSFGNLHVGLQDQKQSIIVKPSSGAAFTPSKMLLMGGEAKMNLLHPDGKRLWYASLETGKVISEWSSASFQEKGAETPMLVS